MLKYTHRNKVSDLKRRKGKNMKFKKVANVFMFSKYVREDGKYTIESVDRRINGALKNVFEVSDANGVVIDTMPRLRDAKAKYAED